PPSVAKCATDPGLGLPPGSSTQAMVRPSGAAANDATRSPSRLRTAPWGARRPARGEPARHALGGQQVERVVGAPVEVSGRHPDHLGGVLVSRGQAAGAAGVADVDLAAGDEVGLEAAGRARAVGGGIAGGTGKA